MSEFQFPEIEVECGIIWPIYIKNLLIFNGFDDVGSIITFTDDDYETKIKSQQISETS